MGGKQYPKGRRREHKTRDALKEEGFQVVRSAGSKTGVDLVAWNDKQVRFIQVKSGGLPTVEERGRMLRMRVPPNATKEIWVWEDYGRKPKLFLLTETA